MRKSTIIKITAIVLGVIIIPLAYSLLYLGAFNDPYSKLETLPIAVVNNDKGAVINGSQRNVGNEIVDNLKSDAQLGWNFTNKADAEDGVKGTKYYAVITIPESFSSDVASAQNTTKTTSTIYYKTNEKRNYIGGQIISKAMLILQKQVISNVDKELTVEMVKKFNEVPDQMNQLNDGLGKLKDGTQQVAGGAGKLKDATQQLADGTSTLKDGTQQLADGTGQVKNGSQQLADGTSALKDGTQQLASGTSSLKDGTQQLADGTSSLKDGTQQLANGTNSLKDGTQQLADGTRNLKNGTQQLATGTNSLQNGIGSLKDGSVKLANGVLTLDNGMTTIASGSDSLNKNLLLYKTNFDTLVSQESLLNNGAKAKLPVLVSGVSSLDQGILKCFNGSSALSDGISQFITGFGKFAYGQKALNDSVNSSLPVLVKGIQNLNTSVNTIPVPGSTATTTYADVTAQYVDGVNTLQSSYENLIDKLDAAKDDPENLKTNFAAIMTELQKNQTTMQTQSQQLKASGNLLKDGSAQICDGASRLNKSVEQIQVLQKSINDLETATEQLQASAALLQQGSSGLTSGLADAKTGADALNAGAQALTSGDSNMADSLAKLTDALSQLQAATDKLSSGSQSLNTGIQSAKSGTSQLNGQVPTLQNGINDLYSGAQQVNAGAQKANDGAQQLDAGAVKVNDGAQQANIGAQKVNDGAQQVNSGAQKANDGAQQVNSGAQQANSGAQQANDGAQQLNTAIGKVNDGAQQVNDGEKKANDGAQQISDGESKLNDGAQQVNDGTSTIKDSVQNSMGDTDTQLQKLNGMDEYSASPVSVTEEKLEAVPNYGTAFAPYFMSLSLWVGGLIMFFGIYLDPDKRMKILSRASDRKLLRTAFFFLISLAQSILLAILVKWVLNLQVNNIGGYFLACILISLVFVSIVQFFIVHCGDVGKLLALLMLILQLTSCGGTFPMETVPKLFNVLYPFMPMTYSVNLLKEVISGHSAAIITKNSLILLAIGAVFAVLTIVLSIVKKTITSDDNSSLKNA